MEKSLYRIVNGFIKEILKKKVLIVSIHRLILSFCTLVIIIHSIYLDDLQATVIDLGIDVLVENHFHGLEGKKIGLITNLSAVNKNGISTLELFYHCPQVNLVAIFTPEYGLYCMGSDKQSTASYIDPYTNLPVYPLQGETVKPTDDMLANIDVLVFDLQDIGTRSFTFLSTMGLAMEAAGENGKEFYVLDRPNPLGGERVEGMPFNNSFRSFYNEWDIPYIHGMTPCEIAGMINGENWIFKKPKLTLVPMKNWQRHMLWKDTGLPWMPLSPYLTDEESPFYFAISSFLGLSPLLNNGIGTALPYKLVGAQKIDPFTFARNMNKRKIPFCYFRPVFYWPFFGKFQGKTLGGCQIHIQDFSKVKLVEIGLTLLQEMMTELNQDPLASLTAEQLEFFDRYCGTDEIRKELLSGKRVQAIMDNWIPYLENFKEKRKKYLLYPSD
ncbi:exo-beta-N-acetylmuramidase NamZ family protein [Methylacidiphilum kamchatkense]|uniref:YbbC (DUF1343 family) n=1 Tax=Methylacidiphilum kamchatkense Kam1 TaxID=1202785 RepID=A0A516TN13_9BACT|nr:DUF1343 domain-containing protein [Methylacidiphilum kamchatkense]QDQ42615.1 YbbC (DUF1343 family) [Methylacidiphilum kamchatkense Kam1]